MTGFPRANGLRLIRIVIVCVAIGTVINSTGGVLLFVSNQARVSDICDLVINTHIDRVKRYAATIGYLRTPAGRQRTALNEYIRVKSLPQTRAEVIAERRNLPPGCVEGRVLPAIPKYP